MKKVLSAILLFALLALCLTACVGNEPADDKKTVDLTTPATDKDNFVYEGGKITALTEAGKAKETLAIPADATAIAADVLKTSTALKNLVIGERTTAFNLDNGAFNGTKSLNVYIACTTEQVTCGGEALLTGATGLTLYIVSAQYANFKNDYTWGKLADSMKKYEG